MGKRWNSQEGHPGRKQVLQREMDRQGSPSSLCQLWSLETNGRFIRHGPLDRFGYWGPTNNGELHSDWLEHRPQPLSLGLPSHPQRFPHLLLVPRVALVGAEARTTPRPFSAPSSPCPYLESFLGCR